MSMQKLKDILEKEPKESHWWDLVRAVSSYPESQQDEALTYAEERLEHWPDAWRQAGFSELDWVTSKSGQAHPAWPLVRSLYKELDLQQLSSQAQHNDVSQLTELTLDALGHCDDLSMFQAFTQLKVLRLVCGSYPSDLSGLTPLSTLEEIELDCTTEVDSFAPLSTLPSLKHLRLVEAPLRSLSALAGCVQLVSLKLIDCKKLADIHALEEMKELEEVILYGSPKIENIDSFRNLPKLKKLSLYRCVRLESLEPLASLQGLEELNLSECWKLTHVDELAGLENLRVLYLDGCRELQHLNGLANTPNLEELHITRCRNLTDASGLAELPRLHSIYSSKTPNLRPKPRSARLYGEDNVRVFQAKLQANT
ncbi:MAG: leucine-rich repeat domain-containing protein [Deltaproteobacteria bacterium]|nr:MAG: leucine-rich repeat domain-containing protein [Deltaproteobacteria bacterium]